MNESKEAIQVESENLALHDNEYLSSFDIYPNPANETITVTFVLKADVSVKAEINTLEGKTVMELASEKLKSGKYDLRNNISAIKAGVYLYTLKIGNEFFTKQLLIK